MTHTAAKIIIKIQIKFFLVVDFIVFPLFLQLYIKPYLSLAFGENPQPELVRRKRLIRVYPPFTLRVGRQL